MAGPRITSVVLEQNGLELFMFAMNSEQLRKLCYVTPKSQDDPEEVQRLVKKQRAKQIGEYIQDANSILPNAIVVNLVSEVQITRTDRDNVRTIEFPEAEGKFAYVLDGQHRLAGFEYSGGIHFDLPVVAMHNADETLRGKVFADINSKQERVSDVHLLDVYYHIKALPQDDAPIVDVIVKLNEDGDSPLKGKIKRMDSDKKTWVKSTMLKKWLSPHLGTGGVLARKTSAEKCTIVKRYFQAVQQLWSDEWGDPRKYSLCKPIGFELILGPLAAVIHRCDLNWGRQYSVVNFVDALRPVKNCVIELPRLGSFTLDWKVGAFSFLSNSATRSQIIKLLIDKLREADEDGDAPPSLA